MVALSIEKFEYFKDIDRSLEAKWEHFLSNGTFPDALRPVISKSWERCLSRRINPLKRQADIVLMDEHLQVGRENNQVLLEAALPWMEEMYQYFSDKTMAVVVCDAQGVILDGKASPGTWSKLERTNFIPGADWSEERAGTNAIGTALTEQQPVQVFAAEHFCQGWHPWVCSAAPIKDPVTGTLLGVLDVTGKKNLVQAHDLHLVTLQAKKIEQTISEKLIRQNFELIQLLFDIIQEPVVIFNRQGTIVRCNGAASRLLRIQSGSPLANVLHEPQFPDFLSDLKDKPVIGYYRSADGMEWQVDVRPYRYADRLLGGLALFKKITSSAKRPSSVTASAWEKRTLKKAAGTRYTITDVITVDPTMRSILAFAERVAATDATVLITGETGTGKEMLAQSIHAHSFRRNGPFIGVNCGAIPKELMASELFGYEGGAFTGAKPGGKKGWVTLAEGGTLFLDEIGDLSLEAQVYLLRMLEGREVYPIGSTRPVTVNVRIIAATHKNLEHEVRRGRFREDLYYRLKVVYLSLPPLRERKQDIPLLVKHFLRTSRHGGPEASIEKDALDILVQYPWPGNVRQLKNCVEQALISSLDGKIKVENLPDEIRGFQSAERSERTENSKLYLPSEHRYTIRRPTRSPIDKETLIRAIEEAGGNISQAARMLQVSRMTIYRKLKEFSIRFEQDQA